MSLQPPSGHVLLDMARDGVINSKGDEMDKELIKLLTKVWEIYFIPEVERYIKQAKENNPKLIKDIKKYLVYKQSFERLEEL